MSPTLKSVAISILRLSFILRTKNSFQEVPSLLGKVRTGHALCGRSSHSPQGATIFRIIPLYLIYRPANNIPYATLEEDLGKPLQTYCSRQWGCAGAPAASSSSEPVQKCQTFQHWLYQWTNGSFLVTDLAGMRVGARRSLAWKRVEKAEHTVLASSHLVPCVFPEGFGYFAHIP